MITPHSGSKPFLLAVAAWFLLVHGPAFAGGKPSTEGVATENSWPMFRGQPSLIGVAPGKLADKLSLLWTFKTGAPTRSSAAVAGGKVFIGSDDTNVYAL